MLEIIILYKLAKRIGAIVEEKGRRKVGYQFMLVALWFGGEILGAIVGAVVGVVALDGESPMDLMVYLSALVGAIIGAVIAFRIAKSLAPLAGDEQILDAIDYADSLGARDHFGDRGPSPAATDGYTDGAAKARQKPDDRIQEP